MANLSQGQENENPGALAGATGAENEKKASEKPSSRLTEYLTRIQLATALEVAIRDAHASDAASIMSAALTRMMAGSPPPLLLSAVDEASSWAEWATPDERKAYCLASFNAMPPKDRASFLAYVQRSKAA
ncbi:hypothetical protein [Szabonella alba]|uniref:Uncharacterized protein n=1 Tax=Szabonella alba TaxID=2804194 RepID=A0A8K0V5C3_9RHOB|nr:hypothetical protein [Szabonella alba]MBL4915683.1 hypothetical protein [Szabonella alba]